MLSVIQAKVPGFEVRTKSESTVMRMIAAILIFNPRFLTEFITTLFTIMFAPRTTVTDDGVAHEGVHAYDYVRAPVRFVFGYLFPQVLAVAPLVGLIVTIAAVKWYLLVNVALPFLAWWFLAFRGQVRFASIAFYAGLTVLVVQALACSWVAGLIFALLLVAAVAPFPAPWRVQSELRGYAMTMACTYWRTGEIPAVLMAHIHSQFVGWNYYKMSWDPSGMHAKLNAIKAAILDDSITKDPIFAAVKAAIPRPTARA